MKRTSLAVPIATCALAALMLGRGAGAQEAGGVPKPGDAAQAPEAQAAQEAEPPQNLCLGKARLRGGFAFKAEAIEPGAQVVLDLIAQTIVRDCGGKTVVIEGHTDMTGGPEFNQHLSERRAETVEAYLVAHGVPASQLRTIGYGETRPLSTDPSPEAQALNRRVTFVVEEP